MDLSLWSISNDHISATGRHIHLVVGSRVSLLGDLRVRGIAYIWYEEKGTRVKDEKIMCEEFTLDWSQTKTFRVLM